MGNGGFHSLSFCGWHVSRLSELWAFGCHRGGCANGKGRRHTMRGWLSWVESGVEKNASDFRGSMIDSTHQLGGSQETTHGVPSALVKSIHLNGYQCLALLRENHREDQS